MKITASPNSGIPIYEQIKEQIRTGILNQELIPGDMLPSIRSLAKDLRIGVLTVNRAYAELEQEGYLTNVQGRGCYVAEESSDLIRKHLTGRAAQKLSEAIGELKQAGLGESDIFALFRQYMEE